MRNTGYAYGMKPDRKEARASQIEQVAFDLLDKRGAAGLSMRAVAKAARASNETLYRWYGDLSLIHI